jgi:mannose-P-dolichol utilization defect protein 1
VAPTTISNLYPQIWLNFSNGSTGQLSAITVFLTFAGSLARVFTTFQEMPDDAMMIASFVIASSLNGVLFAQVLYYWNVAPKAKEE